MVECNFIEYDKASSFNNQQSRLNKINEIKDNFIAEIKERELMSKRLSKYIACCDYFDKFLIVYQQQAVVFLLHHLQQLLENLLE